MSISLPNGTILAAPSSSTSQVSAAVTRILHLSNFSADLKTRDLQAMFKDWENEKGGFRIKWVDDVNALVVFSDALVAKRAYLSILLQPPPIFPPPANIKPYDRPDAAQIIQSLAARSLGHRSSMSSATTSGQFAQNPNHPNPVEGLPQANHNRAMSMANPSSSLNNFVMPTKLPLASRASISNPNNPSRIGPSHNRNGSSSSMWGRQSLSGVLNFGSQQNSGKRLVPHSESSSPDASSVDDPDPMVLMETNVPLKVGGKGTFSGGVRRESVSADKAMREVQKALAASVEAQG